jgi:hypothetical protein
MFSSKGAILMAIEQIKYEQLKKFYTERRGSPNTSPDASISVPVNAQGDLETVFGVLEDIARYQGKHTFEVILAINNYPEGEEPPEIELFRSMGILVQPTPSVRRPEEAVCFSARMTGVRAANTDHLLLFDADCQIPNATAVIDWYIEQLHHGTKLAYTHVGHYGLRNRLSIWARMVAHHGARWVKRQLLGIPTTRGSNYAVNKTNILRFYEQGLLSDDLNVGPTFKAHHLPIKYSGSRQLVVLTSGRVFSGGWLKLIRYLLYRLRYNLKMLPVGHDVTKRIRRGSDNIRKVKTR